MDHRCLACGSEGTVFLDLGPMPLASAFRLPDQPDEPFRYRLAAARCGACHLVQLTEPVPRELVFDDEYPYYSSTSRFMVRHFGQLADWLVGTLGRADPFVVELGSNDGILLDHLKGKGARHLGVEPAANLASVAQERGLRTRAAFFDEALAGEIRAEDGPADAVVGCNVFTHLPDLNPVIRAACSLLKPEGLLVIEDPYLPEVLRTNAFDQFYDEHVWYFTATGVAALARRHGLELVDALPQKTHGGSMRYVLAGSGDRSQRVADLLAGEAELGLHTDAPYRAFAERVERNRVALMELLNRLREEGRRVMGYGATAKSVAVINYCGISTAHLEAISDTTPIKQGRLSPGAGIPVVPHERFLADPPDYALLFAWNHSAEIWEKEQAFQAGGGRWITYVPEVKLT